MWKVSRNYKRNDPREHDTRQRELDVDLSEVVDDTQVEVDDAATVSEQSIQKHGKKSPTRVSAAKDCSKRKKEAAIRKHGRQLLPRYANGLTDIFVALLVGNNRVFKCGNKIEKNKENEHINW